MTVLQIATYWCEDDVNELLAGIPAESVQDIRITPNTTSDADDYPVMYTVIYRMTSGE